MTFPVTVQKADGIAWVTIDNPPVNATTTEVRAGLLRAVDAVQDCDSAVLACAGKTFVAGGDMSEFDSPPQEPHLPDVVNAIEASGTPFVAALHGNVLGGGFEIAMACAYRVAAPGTRFGLPEVNLGLIPGAGGTQRAPRLLGWQMAVEMAALGQMKSAEELLAAGGIDLITENVATALPRLLGQGHVPVSTVTVEAPRSFEPLESLALKAAKGRQSPLHNIEALKWATEPFDVGQPKERALHLKLRQSEESRALRHVFFAERRVAKPGLLSGVSAKPVREIVIVGGGLMGSGIATACLMAGYCVTLIERDSAAADAARTTITSQLQGAVKRGKLTAEFSETILGALTTTDTYTKASGADLAIEAVFEDLDAKRDVFQSLAEVARGDTLLATNTSYLNPEDIFADLSNPERCLGMHFFSPAHIMKLVEVIQTRHSSAETLATGFDVARRLRKTPVISGICDGFIGNRVLASYRRAAEYLLADGALPQDVDAAMRAFGMSMGPFEAQDMAGLQIAEANRRRQDAARPPNQRYVPIADQLCAAGRYGVRTGAGWYCYGEGGRTPQPDNIVATMIADYAAKAGITRRQITAEQIQAQLLATMANEGARIVEEGIAAEDAVVDVVKIAGYGFPRWRGGPMHWAAVQGETAIKRTLEQMDAASPESWTRARRYQ